MYLVIVISRLALAFFIYIGVLRLILSLRNPPQLLPHPRAASRLQR